MMAPPVVVLRSEPEAIVEMAKEVEVAPWREVLPLTVKVPLALSAPPTLRMDARVVEPVTAKVPVEVAPVVVSPPLKASVVEVALLGKR